MRPARSWTGPLRWMAIAASALALAFVGQLALVGRVEALVFLVGPTAFYQVPSATPVQLVTWATVLAVGSLAIWWNGRYRGGFSTVVLLSASLTLLGLASAFFGVSEITARSVMEDLDAVPGDPRFYGSLVSGGGRRWFSEEAIRMLELAQVQLAAGALMGLAGIATTIWPGSGRRGLLLALCCTTIAAGRLVYLQPLFALPCAVDWPAVLDLPSSPRAVRVGGDGLQASTHLVLIAPRSDGEGFHFAGGVPQVDPRCAGWDEDLADLFQLVARKIDAPALAIDSAVPWSEARMVWERSSAPSAGFDRALLVVAPPPYEMPRPPLYRQRGPQLTALVVPFGADGAFVDAVEWDAELVIDVRAGEPGGAASYAIDGWATDGVVETARDRALRTGPSGPNALLHIDPAARWGDVVPAIDAALLLGATRVRFAR